MITTYYILDSISGWFPFSIDIVYLLSAICAILVITVKNPIISVLFLIALFITMGGFLIIIDMSFIGLSYLLVYVGAVSILFLFILMLINIRVSELINETRNSIPLVFIIALLFGSVSYILLPQESTLYYKTLLVDSIKVVFSNTLVYWDNYLSALSHITNIGNVMYSTLSIWLVVVSIILLLAMVGAIVINIKPKTLDVYNKIESIQVMENTLILQSKIISSNL